MSGQHTPEPWIYVEHAVGYGAAIMDAEGFDIYSNDSRTGPVQMDYPDMKRAVACVNACAGLANPAALRGIIDEIESVLADDTNQFDREQLQRWLREMMGQ